MSDFDEWPDPRELPDSNGPSPVFFPELLLFRLLVLWLVSHLQLQSRQQGPTVAFVRRLAMGNVSRSMRLLLELVPPSSFLQGLLRNARATQTRSTSSTQ